MRFAEPEMAETLPKCGYDQAKAEHMLILEKLLIGKVGAEVTLFLLDT